MDQQSNWIYLDLWEIKRKLERQDLPWVKRMSQMKNLLDELRCEAKQSIVYDARFLCEDYYSTDQDVLDLMRREIDSTGSEKLA